jgi:FKBP-type peptidyl-prolyl cis-trans isomerase FklB
MKRTALLMVTLQIVMIAAGQSKSNSSKPATTKPATSTSLTMKSPLDSFSYAIGMSVGKFYKQQGINSIKTNLMLKGIGDAMNEKGKPMMDEMQCNMVVQSYITELRSKKAAEIKLKGKKFLDSVSRQAGVVKLSSGLLYKVLKAGNDSAHPKVTDTVKFHYTGMLTDGTVFDSSVKNGEPLIHPVNKLVPGMTEALLLMTRGSKWVLFIPSDLGYGDGGAGDVIPPGAVLIFELELLDIVNK